LRNFFSLLKFNWIMFYQHLTEWKRLKISEVFRRNLVFKCSLLKYLESEEKRRSKSEGGRFRPISRQWQRVEQTKQNAKSQRNKSWLSCWERKMKTRKDNTFKSRTKCAREDIGRNSKRKREERESVCACVCEWESKDRETLNNRGKLLNK